jgi:hypothetical protein
MKWINKVFKDFEKDPVSVDHPIIVGKQSFEMIGKMTIKWFYMSAGKKVD